MTVNTLSPTDISSAFIAYILADPTIVTAVANDISEANWTSADFTYPSIRIDSNRMAVMLLNGNCKGRWFNVGVSAYIFAEGASSKECQDIMGLVGKRIQNNMIANTVLKSQPLDIDYIPPVPNGIKLWRGEVVISGRMYQL